jgi:hypothetical protein
VAGDWRQDDTRRAKAGLIDTTVPNAASATTCTAAGTTSRPKGPGFRKHFSPRKEIIF